MTTRSAALLDAHRRDGVAPLGRHVPVVPDLVLLPEYALALIAEPLDALGGPRIAADKLLIVADHFAPPSSIERADILNQVRATVERYGWQDQFRLHDGICHQLLLEDPRLTADSVVIGADSHTVTVGAVGAWAAGFGSHDLLYTLITDTIWLDPGPALAVRLTGGAMPPGVMAKDAILALFARLGRDGFHRRSFEFFDETAAGIGRDGRAAICNMVVDGGGGNALFVPDAWRDERAAAYADVVDIDVGGLEPMVARPGSPFDVHPLSMLDGPRISQAFFGSCNAGRLEDFAAFAAVIAGRRVAPGVRAIAIPGSQQVYLDALRAGYIETMIEAGVVVSNPSCGPCGGIDKGILGRGDVCVASMNRNFRGRMGSPEADIWLANPAVVAASAVAGRLVAPAASESLAPPNQGADAASAGTTP